MKRDPLDLGSVTFEEVPDCWALKSDFSTRSATRSVSFCKSEAGKMTNHGPIVMDEKEEGHWRSGSSRRTSRQF